MLHLISNNAGTLTLNIFSCYTAEEIQQIRQKLTLIDTGWGDSYRLWVMEIKVPSLDFHEHRLVFTTPQGGIVPCGSLENGFYWGTHLTGYVPEFGWTSDEPIEPPFDWEVLAESVVLCVANL